MQTWKFLVISGSLLALAAAPAFAGQLCTETGGVSIAETKTLDSGSADTDTSTPAAQPATSSAGVPENQHQGHMHGGGNWSGHGNWNGGNNSSDSSDGS